MVFKVRHGAHRWRYNRVLKGKRKPLPRKNIEVKSSFQFGSQSARESTPIGTFDYEAASAFKKCFVTSWRRGEEIEKLSTIQGERFLGKYRPITKQKNNIGPGSYDINQWPENIFNKTGANVKKDLGFGRTARFSTKVKFSTPGPGYVGENHNPYHYLENKSKQGFSSLPTFEYDGLAPRIQKVKSFGLPPNRYQVQHPDCLDNFLRKRTGKRGPYDLFTGPRDYSSIKGYFTSPIIFEHPDWPNNFPGEIEKLLHKSNHFKGVFGKSSRFLKMSTTKINYPGPGHYDPELPKRAKIGIKCPLETFLEKERKLGCKEIRPSPGQYDPKNEKKIQGSGWTSVFKSKLPRTKSLAKEPYNNF